MNKFVSICLILLILSLLVYPATIRAHPGDGSGPNCSQSLAVIPAGNPSGTYTMTGNSINGYDIQFTSQQANPPTGNHQIDYVFRINGVNAYVYITFVSQSGYTSNNTNQRVRVWAPAWSATVYNSRVFPANTPKYRGQGFTIASATSMTMNVHVDIIGCDGYFTFSMCDGNLGVLPAGVYFGDAVNFTQPNQFIFDGEFSEATGTFYRTDYDTRVNGVKTNVSLTFSSQTGYTTPPPGKTGVRIWNQNSTLIYSSNTYPLGQTFQATSFAIESSTDFLATISIVITQVCPTPTPVPTSTPIPISTPLIATLAYTLPTTGDIVIYQRRVTSEDVIIATVAWALVVLAISMVVYQAARGRL